MIRAERVSQGRLGSRKSSTGCITCKIRRIKCDELRPVCRRCESTGRKCDGYVQDRRAQSVILRQSPATYSNANSDEVRSFEFFIECVVPEFSQIVSQVFWRNTVLQLSRADVIIWDAVLALSRLIQYPQYGYVYDMSIVSKYEKPPINHPDHIRALKWYNKSLTTLRQRLTSGQVSSTIARVSCVVYICIECLQNNIHEAVTLHQQAMALAQAAKSQPKLECDAHLEETLGALMRHMSLLHGLPVSEENRRTRSAQGIFSTLSQAREELYLIIQEARTFCSGISEIKLTQGKDWTANPSQERLSKQIQTKFSMWKSNLTSMPDFSLSSLREHHGELYSIALLAHSHLSIWLSTCLSTYETAYDSFFPIFKSIVEYAGRAIGATRSKSRPVFVFEARIIPTMFFVAIKCRHPVIRRDAISMLRRGPQVENTWTADSMAQLAELIVAIEESGDVYGTFHPEPQITEPPPESYRIFCSKAVELLDEFGRPAHYLNFARWQQDINMNWVREEDRIKIGS